ncbi:MAG TPA: RNA ligase family protein, partial [Dissulfurispiraceae bacterium]|nr:RNA ligase family protein [Dissulfurispiraceae bacterium]
MLKPLGGKTYGSIPHLIGSKRGDGDHGVELGQHRICTEKARDGHDRIIVQVKLDGSNVAVAKINGVITSLTRAGYPATTSPFEMHHLFAVYVRERMQLFDSLLQEGEWVSGEWLALAHGTRYDLAGLEPFVAFDLWRKDGDQR